MKFAKALLQIACSVLAIVWLAAIFRGNAAELGQELRGLRPVYFWAAFGMVLIGAYCGSQRLKMLMEILGAPVRLWMAIRINFLSYLFNTLVPSFVGVDAVRAYYAARHTGHFERSASAVIMDRVIGIMTLLIFAAVPVLTLTGRSTALVHRVFGIVAIALFIVLINFIFPHPLRHLAHALRLPRFKFYRHIRDTFHLLRNFRCGPMKIVGLAFWSMSGQWLWILSNVFLARAVHSTLPLAACMAFIPVIWMVSLLPSIGGLGVREGAYVLILSDTLGAHKAMAVAILWLAIVLMLAAMGAVVFLADNLKWAKLQKETV